MSALPRGTCPACGADVALRKGGQVREHRVYLPQSEQDPSTHLGRTTVCEGSGRTSNDVRFTVRIPAEGPLLELAEHFESIARGES